MASMKQQQSSSLLSLLILSMATLSLSFQFKVGGNKGWTKPPANTTNAYNNWARQTRFRIGDTIYFKYVNDSVLVVNEEEYDACNVNNPISKYTDGKSVIELDHHGFFYFISGNTQHCKAGQKLIIDVMADHYDPSPAPDSAPAPGLSSNRPAREPTSEGGGESWMPKSSADKSAVSSAVMSFVVLGYMFL